MSPLRRPPAESSCGSAAAVLMSATDPAWIPPMSGSTSASTTRVPRRRATAASPRRRGALADRIAGGHRAVAGARPAPGPPSGRSATSGWGRRAADRPEAPAAGPWRRRTHPMRRSVGASRGRPPGHRPAAPGRRPRKPSGPTSTVRPSKGSECRGPPNPRPDSRTVTRGAPGSARSPPVAPRPRPARRSRRRPPRPPVPTQPSREPARLAPSTYPGQGLQERRVVVERGRSGELQAAVAARAAASMSRS